MKIWKVLSLAALLSLMTLPTLANAQGWRDRRPPRRSVPEISATSLGAGAAILVGGAFLLGGWAKRRRKAEKN
jgi:hypothetical protein